MATSPNPIKKRVLLLGATGTIGRAAVCSLVGRGHDVVSVVRPSHADKIAIEQLAGAEIRRADVTNPDSLRRDVFRGVGFDVLVSCLASRTGAHDDAWAVDHQAHSDALAIAKEVGISHMVLLSAICVQKPQLPFQHAKLAFEKELISSGLTYSIVRPTAYFKSLSGQIDRLKKDKPFLVFGDGRLTACKPISARDLGDYIATCLEDPSRQNKVLPVGGPGKAITPREQGELLFTLMGKEPNFKRVPVAMFDIAAGTLGFFGRFFPSLLVKAELARIGKYYATESMLVMDRKTGLYDEAATPSFGKDTLKTYYESLISGERKDERSEHAVF